MSVAPARMGFGERLVTFGPRFTASTLAESVYPSRRPVGGGDRVGGTGLEKSLVAPLAGVTVAPALVMMEGASDRSADAGVPNGSCTLMVCDGSKITPVTKYAEKPKAVMALAELVAATLKARLALHGPAPAAFAARTFQLRPTPAGSFAAALFESLVTPVFFRTTLAPCETRTSYF